MPALHTGQTYDFDPKHQAMSALPALLDEA
jgi:hypothetical protein